MAFFRLLVLKAPCSWIAGAISTGTTSAGGANDLGTAFALNPPSVRAGQWSERVLWNFSGAIDDAANPAAGLIADYWGNLYGTSAGGGAYNRGTVFKLSLH